MLNIVPSLDTPTCATSTRKFNEAAGQARQHGGRSSFRATCRSRPSRFCTTEGIENVVTASTFRGQSSRKAYGVDVTSGPLTGLTARAVVVDRRERQGRCIRRARVGEIKNEPNYDAALAALK